MSQVQGGHDGDTFSTDYGATAFDLSEFLVEKIGGCLQGALFFWWTGYAVFLVHDLDVKSRNVSALKE
jgi:hypothetical protein